MKGRFPLLGISVDPVDRALALARCKALLAGGRPAQVITANPLMLLAAEKDPPLREALAAAALVVPDGSGLAVAALFRGRRLARVPGIDLMQDLCALASETGRTVFLLGSARGVAEAAAHALAKRHPSLRIAGVHHGFFAQAPSVEAAAVSAVATVKPDLLFVALPTPFQDAWIHRNLDSLGAGLVMGVGGSFDVLSGRLRRAPRWMRGIGLEWLFRLAQEPRRWRRMLGLPVFLAKALFQRPPSL